MRGTLKHLNLKSHWHEKVSVTPPNRLRSLTAFTPDSPCSFACYPFSGKYLFVHYLVQTHFTDSFTLRRRAAFRFGCRRKRRLSRVC